MRRTTFNAMPQQVTKQAPPTESWWLSPDGHLPEDKRKQAEQRMSTTIDTLYRDRDKPLADS